jgi:Ice-binding-like
MPSSLYKPSKSFSPTSRLLLVLLGLAFNELTTAQANSMPLQIERSSGGWVPGGNETPADLPDLLSDAAEFSANTNAAPTFQGLVALNENHRSGIGFSLATSNDIVLSGHQTQLLTSSPGSTVTLDLQNFVLTGHSTLTLVGDTTATFIINVTTQLSLARSAKVVLSGGIQWNHVFFNVLGSGSRVSLGGKSSLFGTLTSGQRTVKLNGHAIVNGKIIASTVLVRQAAQVIEPPVVSP